MTPRTTSCTKDGMGTAYSALTCVWVTLSHGMLKELYGWQFSTKLLDRSHPYRHGIKLDEVAFPVMLA